ncbi:Uncharacterised protein [Fusobacterium necrogenes]|uniref:Uncharacterized protein n=1 Tax=Fusobacterium necrogenes TaxID=858 RepID=A0A377GUM9_9FUSO|nr:hypothetical protein [Fusobacterium necrogenes]STO30667.1 Uncharacterised protein [Fusobacterium necrogenes]
MGSKIKKLLMLLIMILGVVLFANEEKKAPNEIIKDNPEREVTTVESMKVRDHATMSLSVTKKNEKVIEGELIGDTLKVKLPIKGINENTLDRIAKPKEGKKLVIESKSRVNPRMARMVTNTTKKMPTQEEMNNLTLEQVKAMMNNSDTKEIETQSKGVKNHIAVENESGIDVEVLDVNRNEDIYVNVEENGEVIDRYKVVMLNQRSAKGNINLPADGDYFFRRNVFKIGISGNIWFGNKGVVYSNGVIKNLDKIEFNGNNISAFRLDDDFIQRESKFASSSEEIFGATVRLKLNSDKTWYYPLIKNNVLGSKGETYLQLRLGPETRYQPFYSGSSGALYEVRNTSGIGVNGFRKVEFYEHTSTANGADYLENGDVNALGLELVKKSSSLSHIGVYKTNQPIKITYTTNTDSKTWSVFPRVAVGDEAKDDQNNGIDGLNLVINESNVKKVINENLNPYKGGWQEIVINDDNNNVSFMKSDFNSDLGLFLQIDSGTKEKIKISTSSIVNGKIEYNNFYTRSYNQGGINQTLKIAVSQNKGEYAKVHYKVEDDSGITNPTNGNPEFVFYLIQGIKREGYVTELRKVRYTLKFERKVPSENKVNIEVQIDERIKETIKNEQAGNYSWIGLNGGFGKWEQIGDEDQSIINISTKYADNAYRIEDIVSVNDKGKDTDVSNNYNRFNVDGADRLDIVFKTGITFTELATKNNLMISPKISTEYNIVYNGVSVSNTQDKKRFASKITLTHVSPAQSDYDRQYYSLDKGFTGNGVIVLTEKTKGIEYTLLNPSIEPENTKELKLNSHIGFLPNFKGAVIGQTDKQIVTKYKISVTNGDSGASNFINIDNDDGYIIGSNLKIRLIKPENLQTKKMIKLTKLKDVNFDYSLKIEYYHTITTGDNQKVEMKLGEYTLTVENEVVEKDLGEASVKLDARITQVDGNYSWIRLSDKRLSKLTEIKSIGNYPEFIGDIEEFSNANNLSQYDNLDITNVESINDSPTLSGPIGLDNVNYKYINGNNEAAIPYSQDTNEITFGQFKETGVNSKLFISKWDFSNGAHNGNNKFKVVADNGIRFVGNIVEKYITQDNPNGISNMAGKLAENTAYKGEGILNLARAVLGQAYTFTAGTTGNITVSSSGYNNRNTTLKITSGKSLDATGVLTTNDNNSIANRMIIKEGLTTLATVDGSVGNELSQSLTDLGVKIGINPNGELVVTKEKDVNIGSKTLTIDYYNIKNSAQDNQNIHLGTFDLTLENYIVGDYDSNKMTIDIDRRFASIVTYNWLFKDGTVAATVDGQSVTKKDYFSDFFKYDGNLQTAAGTIVTNLEMPERTLHHTGTHYDYYHLLTSTTWQGEGAVPKQGNMSSIDNLVTASKGNTSDDKSLYNKFSLVFSDGGTEKIYKGNIEEVIVGEESKSGSGTLDIFNMIQGTEYKFKTSVTDRDIESSDPNVIITEASNPINTKGVIDGTTNKNVANKIRVTFDSSTPIVSPNSTMEIEDNGLKVAINTTDNNEFLGGFILTKIAENITATNVKIEYFYTVDPNSTNIEFTGNSANTIKLGEFTLTIEEKKPVDSGDIIFTVDPRLKQISSIVSENITWLTPNGMFGPWASTSKKDYSGLLYLDNKVTDMTTATIDSVADRVDGTSSSDYIVFENQSSYNDIAFKPDLALNQYGTLDNIMVSPSKDETFVSTFIDSSGSRYHIDVIVDYDDTVPEDGYSGSGVLDISNGIKGTKYLFSAPTDMSTGSGTSTSNGGLSMTITGEFPNTNGVVTGKKSISIADNVVVTVNGREISTKENDSAVIGGEIHKIDEDLKIGLTPDNKIKLIKLAREFNYTGNNKIVIEYKYKDVRLGVFNLDISSDLIEVDLGTLNVKIDNRIIQLPDSHSWIRLDGEVMNLDSGSIGNYKEFIQVGNWSNGESALQYNGNDKIKLVERINDMGISYDSGIYARVQTKNEGAFPERETVNSDYILVSKFIQTGQNSKLVVSKWDVTDKDNSSTGKHDGRNEFFVTGTKEGSEIEVAYKGNIQEKYRDRDGAEKIILDGVTKEETVYKGSGSINLVSAEIGTPYSFTKGGSGNISSTPKITNGRDQNSLLNLFVSSGTKNIDPTSMFDSNKKIANILKVSVNGGTTATIKGTMKEKLETEALTLGEGKVKIGIDTLGNLLITKIEEGNIPNTLIKLDYYYSPDVLITGREIHLGTFDLMILNPIIESSTIPTVTIDKRFAENVHYNWLFRDGRASDDLYQYPGNAQDYSKLFKYSTQSLDNLPTNGEVRDAIGVEGRIHRENSSDTESYRLYHINNTEWRGEAAVPISGLMNNLNNIVTISKGNSEDSISKENKFSLLFEEDGEMKIYKGNIKEEIVGDGVSKGSGEVTFISTDTDITYKFPTTLNNQETSVIGNGTDNRTLAMKNVKTSTGAIQALPNGNGLTEIVGENQVIANKITVSCKDTNLSNAKEVTIDNITFGIGDNGGLTLKKGKDFNPSEDKVYTIKFYYKNPGNDSQGDIELSTFDLTIRDSIFEIDGDGVLNFGDMVYNSNYPYVTQGGIFYVKCNDPAMIAGKKVEFSVDRDKVQPMKNTNGQTGDQNEVPLVNTQVQTRSNGKFYLQSTADLSGRPNTGKYEGEIEVIVTIQDKQP